MCKVRCFEDNICEVNPSPTSFGRGYMRHKSKTCFQDLHFILLDKKMVEKIFRENNKELADFL